MKLRRTSEVALPKIKVIKWERFNLLNWLFQHKF